MEFLEHLAHPTENFRQQIQHFLCKIRGYHHSVLWFTDELGNISHPHLYQIQDKVIFDYLANFDELDFLHPKRYLNKISKQNVFCINDMVPYAKFKMSEFYTDFMKKHHYHDEMVVNFTYKNQLVGTLGLLRSKGERPFDKQDVKRFETISTFISQKISSQLMLENIDYQKRIFEAHADKSPLGLIILDLSFRPLFYNSSARNIMSDLLTNESEKTIDIFVKKYISSQNNVQVGFVRSISSPSFQQYTIHLEPKSEFQKEFVYLVHLIPDISKSTSTSTIDHSLSFLTPREMEICHLIRKGYTNLEIAQQSFISINTVKRHIQNIFSKLDVKNRTGLLSKLDSL